MKAWILLPMIALVLAGCAGKTAYRDSCAKQLNAAWAELDLAKAEGFTGTVSYSKRSEERRVGKECRSRWSPYH